MNKKEIAEIKKLMNKDRVVINRMAGCYVNGEKEKVMTFKESLLALPEEEMTKYLDIFRKALSGSVGRNLLNLGFPLEAEQPGGTHSRLMELRACELKDDDLLNGFYDTIIETWYHPENYLILIVNGAYDVPGKTADGMEMEDASSEVYHFVQCCLCPVELSKTALCYNAETNHIEETLRDWIVGMPEQAFLFPAFNDRGTDLHSLLYYSGDSKEFCTELMENLLGCKEPLTATNQKAAFRTLVEEALGDESSYEKIRSIHENLNEMIDENKAEPEPLTIGQAEVKTLLTRAGASDEAISRMEERFTEDFGETGDFLAANVAEPKKFEVSAPEVSVKVSPEFADLMEIKEIDGASCLVIPLTGEVEVNGILVREKG
ncbi:MAG: DUF4317 domain-containing protein [Lachnospiraceae bacterium]|nr:DUF4317 domain-containing protein [Lachnospiraceae bacterium]